MSKFAVCVLQDGHWGWTGFMSNGQCINMVQEPYEVVFILAAGLGRVVCLNCVLNAHNVSQVLFWICRSCWTANLMISKRWFSMLSHPGILCYRFIFGGSLPPRALGHPRFHVSVPLPFPFLSACTSLSSRGPRPLLWSSGPGPRVVTASGGEAPGLALHVGIRHGTGRRGGWLAPGRVLRRVNGRGGDGASSPRLWTTIGALVAFGGPQASFENQWPQENRT